MARSFSNLVNNFSEGIHKMNLSANLMKIIHANDNNKFILLL